MMIVHKKNENESSLLFQDIGRGQSNERINSGVMESTKFSSSSSSTRHINNSLDKVELDDEQTKAADELTKLLLACGSNEELEQIVLMRSLNLDDEDQSEFHKIPQQKSVSSNLGEIEEEKIPLKKGRNRFVVMVMVALTGLSVVFLLLLFGNLVVLPPRQPVGPYKLTDIQEGKNFFSHYTFYNGLDSEGSNGYINYLDRERAFKLHIANITYELLKPDTNTPFADDRELEQIETEPFVYMSTTPTEDGPRNSVRLEGLKRYNRGLFIIDVRHMPAGCGTWPAFWLTDEANWPVNGEIDIVEGVNTQTRTKTALHTSRVCAMDDVPLGVKTGIWDTAQGVPMKNGSIDTTLREANDCFVYNPHQWLNQGCVAMSDRDDSIGTPFNEKGGGVYALEWDPINRFIKSWVFTPHEEVPENLRNSMRTARMMDKSKRVAPNPNSWSLPYAYFPIGQGTKCPASHFRNMHLIFNTALCGSVSGNRFWMDCPDFNKKYGSCEDYIKANTSEMNEIYWKIRGVYIYEREWQRLWG